MSSGPPPPTPRRSVLEVLGFKVGFRVVLALREVFLYRHTSRFVEWLSSRNLLVSIFKASDAQTLFRKV